MTTHDSGYHLLFSHPELVEDLFKHFVDQPGLEHLDFTTLDRVNAKFHADGLERRDGDRQEVPRDDIIYRVRYRDGTPVYLYLLLEFQSQPDPWMALRVLVYVGLLYQHLVRTGHLTDDGQLPPVFPLVLYNGDARHAGLPSVAGTPHPTSKPSSPCPAAPPSGLISPQSAII